MSGVLIRTADLSIIVNSVLLFAISLQMILYSCTVQNVRIRRVF